MYLGLVVLLNVLVALLLLMGTNRLAGCACHGLRILVASLVAGIHAGLCLKPEFWFLGGRAWRLTVLGAVAALAFGTGRGAVKRCCLFVLLSFSLGGLSQCLNRQGIPALLLGALGLLLLSWGAFSGWEDAEETVEVVLRHAGKQVAVKALKDTGNTLRDPVSGERVLILGSDAARELTGLTYSQLCSPLETMAAHALPGLRLIPYRTVGQSSGMLLGMRLGDCLVRGKRCSPVVGFAPEGLDAGSRYQALTGGVI